MYVQGLEFSLSSTCNLLFHRGFQYELKVISHATSTSTISLSSNAVTAR